MFSHLLKLDTIPQGPSVVNCFCKKLHLRSLAGFLIYTYICIYMYMYIHIYTNIYIYVYIYTHTHIYIYYILLIKKNIFISHKYFSCFTKLFTVCVDEALDKKLIKVNVKMTLSKNHLENKLLL